MEWLWNKVGLNKRVDSYRQHIFSIEARPEDKPRLNSSVHTQVGQNKKKKGINKKWRPKDSKERLSSKLQIRCFIIIVT